MYSLAPPDALLYLYLPPEQMTCVPDEYSSMLGSQGFTHGVGPGNLGLSVNVNI